MATHDATPGKEFGQAILKDPHRNRGSAFTLEQRVAYRIEGLLPPAPTTLTLQVARIHAELAHLTDDIQKYLLLSDLQARNETLFYAVVMSDPATFMPLVYTPTVGEACQKFDHIFRSARGLYLPITARGRVKELLANWPNDDVRFIVVTDGERILGLGDLGVGGMGIPIGKLSLYTACAGVPPEVACRSRSTSAPTITTCSRIRSTSACGRSACAARNTMPSSTSSSRRCSDAIPKCCIQWEDFANINAVPILERYRDRICTYNDDIQGTAAVALAGIYAALRITGGKLADQRFLFLGGGSAATGIAELISAGDGARGRRVSTRRAPATRSSTSTA